MKKKVTYVISGINKSLSFEWTTEALFQEFELSFILLNNDDSEFEQFLKAREVDVKRIPYSGKKDLPSAIWKLIRIFRKEKPDIVHTHLFDASIAGLIAARISGIKERILTRHHATFHHEYFPSAVKYDRFINSLATRIVAISENVRQTLTEKENVPASKIKLIHHGFDLSVFSSADPGKVEELRKKYSLENKGPVIGVISRYFELKGIQYLIPAFQIIRKRYPDAVLVLANAKGSYANEIKTLLETLPKNSYREVGFESDIASFYQLFDVFVHVPVNPHCEAFGQTYIEALAAGIPSVFTLSGVAPEFIKDTENAIVVPFRDATAIEVAIKLLLTNRELAEKLSAKGKADVSKLFNLERMISRLRELYNSSAKK